MVHKKNSCHQFFVIGSHGRRTTETSMLISIFMTNNELFNIFYFDGIDQIFFIYSKKNIGDSFGTFFLKILYFSWFLLVCHHTFVYEKANTWQLE